MYWRILQVFEEPLYLLRCGARDNVLRISYSVHENYTWKTGRFEDRREAEDNYNYTKVKQLSHPTFKVLVKFDNPNILRDESMLAALRLILMLFKPYAEYAITNGVIARGQWCRDHRLSPPKLYLENLLWSMGDATCPLLFKDSWLHIAYKPSTAIVLETSYVCRSHWKKDCDECIRPHGFFRFEVTPVTQFYQVVAKINILNKQCRSTLAQHAQYIFNVMEFARQAEDPNDLVFPNHTLAGMSIGVKLIESVRSSLWHTLPTDENKFVLAWAQKTFHYAKFTHDYWGTRILESLATDIEDLNIRKYFNLLITLQASKVSHDPIERAIVGSFRREILFSGRPIYSYKYSCSDWEANGGTMTFEYGFHHPLAFMKVGGVFHPVTRNKLIVPATRDFQLVFRTGGYLLGSNLGGGHFHVEQRVFGQYNEDVIVMPRFSHLNCSTCNIQLNGVMMSDVVLSHRNHRMVCDFGKFTLTSGLRECLINKNTVRQLFFANCGDAHPRGRVPYLNKGSIRMNCITCSCAEVVVRKYSDGSPHVGHEISSIFGKRFFLTRSMLRDPIRLMCINRYGITYHANLKFQTDIVPPTIPKIKGRKRGPPLPVYLQGWV